MKSFLAWLKSAKWIALVVLAVGAGVLLLVLRKMFWGPKPEGPTRLPDVPPALQKKVEKAQEEAIKAKVEAKITAEIDKKEVEEILQIDDGAERRKRLAEKLKNL
jgi:hypothetical protein